MSDIFISYAREDQPRAEMLAQLLEGRGWSIFWDRTIPIGKTWRETIGSALDDAHCVIVLWSKISIKSAWVQDEADEAKRRGVLVPILIENVQPPMGFRSIQAAHLENWDGTELTQAFGRLIADIAALIGPPPKEAANESRQVQAEIESKAEEERKLAESQAKLETAVRRKVDEVAVARREAEKEKREPPFAPMSQALRSATPELRQQLDHVSSKQPKTAAVPWRIIAGSAIIAGVIATVAVWQAGLPVTPQSVSPQPAPPVTSQPVPSVTSQPATPITTLKIRPAPSGTPQSAPLVGAAQPTLPTPQSAPLITTQPTSPVAPQAAPLVTARPTSPVAPQSAPSDTLEDANAMYSKGERYHNGQGVTQDYAKAREWYEKAADGGNTNAMFGLGLLYANG